MININQCAQYSIERCLAEHEQKGGLKASFSKVLSGYYSQSFQDILLEKMMKTLKIIADVELACRDTSYFIDFRSFNNLLDLISIPIQNSPESFKMYEFPILRSPLDLIDDDILTKIDKHNFKTLDRLSMYQSLFMKNVCLHFNDFIQFTSGPQDIANETLLTSNSIESSILSAASTRSFIGLNNPAIFINKDKLDFTDFKKILEHYATIRNRPNVATNLKDNEHLLYFQSITDAVNIKTWYSESFVIELSDKMKRLGIKRQLLEDNLGLFETITTGGNFTDPTLFLYDKSTWIKVFNINTSAVEKYKAIRHKMLSFLYKLLTLSDNSFYFTSNDIKEELDMSEIRALTFDESIFARMIFKLRDNFIKYMARRLDGVDMSIEMHQFYGSAENRNLVFTYAMNSNSNSIAVTLFNTDDVGDALSLYETSLILEQDKAGLKVYNALKKEYDSLMAKL